MIRAMTRQPRGLERRALELDFELYRVAVPLADQPGFRLSVIDMRPPGVQQTLLLQHGYAGCAETWEHQITALSARFRIVAPDLRGHGQSDAPDGRYDLDALCADLDAIVAQLALPQRFTLVGHSFGGALALAYAARRPERLDHLVLVATPAAFPLPPGSALLSRLPTWVLRLLWPFRPRWNATPMAMKRMFGDSLRPWRTPKTDTLSGLPTLLLNGARDRYFPDRVYDALAACLPWAERVDVGAAKHKVQLERPAAVTRAIEDFVGAGPPRRWRDPPIEAGQVRRGPWLASYPLGTPLSVPLPAGPLQAFLSRAAARHPRRAALVFAGQRWSYRRLERDGNRLAWGLIALGLQPGDRVVMRLDNRPELHLACFGVLKAGGVIVLPSPGASSADLTEQLRRSRARLLIARAADGAARQAAARAAIEQILLVGRTLDPPIGDGSRTERPLTELLTGSPERPPERMLTPEAPALLAFTRRTGSDPPLVALSQANLVANAIQLRHWLPPSGSAGIRVLTALPLDQVAGLALGLSLPLMLAATVVLAPEGAPGALARLARHRRPTLLIADPEHYARLLEQPDLAAWRLDRCMACLSVGEPLPIERVEAFERMTRTRLVEVYHSERLAAIGMAQPWVGRWRPGSMGFPLPNTEARIVEPRTGRDLPSEAVGRLLLRGPQFAAIAANAAVLGTAEVSGATEDRNLGAGWLDTGDLAVMDSGGGFRLIGPADGCILGPDGPVYPRDVSEVLYAHGAVRDVAVFGDGAPAGFEQVLAGVTLRAGAEIDPRQLMTHCRRRLPAVALPKELRVLSGLPRLASGVLDLVALRQVFAAAPPASDDRPSP